MKHIKINRTLASLVLGAGLLAAQAPAPSATAPVRKHMRRGAHVQALAAQLNLTTDQQAQAKQIFADAAQSSRPLHQQMRDAHLQLRNDAKTGATADVITRDSNAVGALAAQKAAIRTNAFAKFNAIL